jgi:hypothetical protein
MPVAVATVYLPFVPRLDVATLGLVVLAVLTLLLAARWRTATVLRQEDLDVGRTDGGPHAPASY